MKVVVASDKFKGSLTSYEVATCIENGIKKVDKSIEVVKVPMADGGEGTLKSLVEATGGEMVKLIAKDPLMRPIECSYGLINDKKMAIIEMAEVSGLMLLKENERNPLKTTTYGLGQLICDAMDKGCETIIIGIGGSATNDGGAGMLKALGVKFLDAYGNDVGADGESLGRICTIDMSGMDKRVRDVRFIVACDVDNPLYGPNGASYIYGPQKGADDAMLELLDRNLKHYGDIIDGIFKKPISSYPGSGAAGGLGAGLMAFLGAELEKGIDLIIKLTNLEEKIKSSDIVVTGEGKIDSQTVHGKTPFGVAELAKKYGIPVIAICGTLAKGYEILYQNGFDSIFSITDGPMTLEDALKNSRELIEAAAYRIFRLIKIYNNN